MNLRDSAVDRTAGFETFVGYMYLDTNGHVTLGYGRMLPNAGSAVPISLKSAGAAATDQQKRDEWTTIQSKETGHVASYYEQFTTLTLDEADAKQMLRDDLNAAAADLATRFSSLDDYPNAVQDALLDMMFNIGITKFTRANWPSLFTAVEAKDWQTAATESHRTDVSSARNDAIRDLFLSAAAGFALAAMPGLQRMVGQSFSQLLGFIASGQKIEKFYPDGITNIKMIITLAGAEFNLNIEGPGHGHPETKPHLQD